MSCSRRDFTAGMSAGALIMMTGPVRAGTAILVHSQTINGVRYGMLHDETACIGCTACMDACREVNTGARRGLCASRSSAPAPSVNFPMPSTTSFASPASTATTLPCVHVCPTGASHIRKEDGIVDVYPDPPRRLRLTVWPPAPSGAL